MSDPFKVPRSFNTCAHCGLDFRIFTTAKGAQLSTEVARLRREKEELVEAIREYVSADDKITDDENTERAATRLSDAIDGLRAAIRSATGKGEPT